MINLVNANVFKVTIVRTRPSESVLWFDDAIRLTTNQAVDGTMGNTIFTQVSTSSDNLTRTVVRYADEKETLQSFISALDDANSVYHAITAYGNAKNITVTISDIEANVANPQLIPVELPKFEI